MNSLAFTIVSFALVLTCIAYCIVKYIGKSNTKEKREVYLNLKVGDKVICKIKDENKSCRVISKGDLGYKVRCNLYVVDMGWRNFVEKI